MQKVSGLQPGEMTLAMLSTLTGKSGDTLKRHEAKGKIPRARRDERGYRIWSKDQVDKIISTYHR